MAEVPDPLIEAFDSAPLDDEPVTPEDEVAIAEAETDLAAGRAMSLDEALREHE